MENKKSAKANLEKMRTIFFEIGLIIGLSLVLFAFEWPSNSSNSSSLGKLESMEYDEVLVPITRREEPKKEIIKQKPIEIIKIVENDKILKEEAIFETSETSEDDKTEIIKLPEETLEEDIVYIGVQETPEFPGGYAALLSFIYANIKYPDLALQVGISGTVHVEFVIGKKGKVREVALVRGIDPMLDNEAIRVVKLLPDWTPGKQCGKPVSVRYNVPITFELR